MRNECYLDLAGVDEETWLTYDEIEKLSANDDLYRCPETGRIDSIKKWMEEAPARRFKKLEAVMWDKKKCKWVEWFPFAEK